MKRCPYCAEEIQDDAIKCRYCGEFLDGRQSPVAPVPHPAYGAYWNYEYRSPAQILGIPLLHIARGINPRTGMPYVARGIVAIGNLAFGVVALGGVSVGVFAAGGLSLGVLFAIGGIALGAVAVGGVALGALLAVGGLAISLGYALGGMAIAPRALGGSTYDLEMLRRLRRWLTGKGE